MLRSTEMLLRRNAIVGAAFDYDRLLSGKQSMPAVVPRIEKRVADQILVAITLMPQSNAIRNLERDIGYLDGYQDVQAQRRRNTLQKQMQEIKQQLVPVDPKDAQAQISNLALMRGLSSIHVEHGIWIKAITAPIYIQAQQCHCRGHQGTGDVLQSKDVPPPIFVYLGRYALRINMSSRDFPGAIAVARLTRDGVEDQSRYVHPHIASGSICWGSFAISVGDTLRKGKLDLLLSLLLQHLATYNRQSPFADLCSFKKGGRYDVTRLGG